MTAEQAFPGATGVTLLDVYDWPTADGLRGGSAHIHLASTEGYLAQLRHVRPADPLPGRGPASRFVTVAAGGIGCW